MSTNEPELQEGQPVHLQWGNQLLRGLVREVQGASVALAFPIATDIPGEVVVTWPNGQTTLIEGEWVAARQILEVRLPRPTLVAPEGLSPPTEQRDQRNSVRIDAGISLAITLGTRDVQGQTLNISGSGMLVHAITPLPVGKEVAVRLLLAQGSLEETVRVLRKVGHQTYAMRFLGDPSSGPGRMRRIMAHMRPSSVSSRKSWNLRRP